MQNPWLDLPTTEPFVLPCDKEIIRTFNNQAKPKHLIHLDLLPEPYLGDPQANIVLLNGNPGFKEGDHLYHHNDDFVKANRATLCQESQEYPFYLLNPQFEKSLGSIWWRKRLRRLLDRYDLKKIANEIFVIECFPYHSENFGFDEGILLSQQYSVYLLEEAMNRDALIIVMRNKEEWQTMCPRLSSYHRSDTLKNWRSVWITEGNFRDRGYLEILSVLG